MHAVILIHALFFMLITINPGSSLSLYSPDDPLHELDSSNFESVILGKSNAWIVEFYNNWCGHCIRFAPKWKQFSRDIRTWRNIIDVAVVNCADSHNVKLCRNYDVSGFPTIKLFTPFANESYKGVVYNGERDIDKIETKIVKYLESYQCKAAPTDWPELRPLKSKNLKDVRNLLKDNEGSVILFIEHPGSYLGRKVIMDLSFQNSVVVRRVLTTNENLLSNFENEVRNSSLATVLQIDKNNKEHLIARYSEENSTFIRDQIFYHVVGTHRSQSDQVFVSKTQLDIKVSFQDSVHMTDLENALRYLLYQEIGVTKHIYGNRLDALKSFTLTLKNYFPGKISIMKYVSKLNDWVSKQKNITGEEFVQNADALQTDEEFLPQMREFVGCRGSEPKYRGYPCSLWTLFHTLSVQAYIVDEETAGGLKDEVMTVLPNIKNYIKYFFTCDECVQNFFKMDQKIERDSNTSANVVLWLWAAHNQVNHRLAGDITEDPQHPKIQFPPPTMCPSCRLKNETSDDIKWDEVKVLRFLRHFYGKQNIVIADSSHDIKGRSHHSSQTIGNSSMVIFLKNVSFAEKWRFQWFTSADISLCVSLYLVSSLFIIFITLLFRQRRKRRKSHIHKYINLYP